MMSYRERVKTSKRKKRDGPSGCLGLSRPLAHRLRDTDTERARKRKIGIRAPDEGGAEASSSRYWSNNLIMHFSREYAYEGNQ